MRRYERSSTLLTSTRPVEDWGKLLQGEVAFVSSMLDRMPHPASRPSCAG
jgi:IstB-like ATP binding protein